MMFVQIKFGDNQVVSIEGMRVTGDWRVSLIYAVTVSDQVTAEIALKPIAAMLGRSDIIIFQTQRERDVFIKIAKRCMDKPVSARTRIIPVGFTRCQHKDLKLLLRDLCNTGLSVADFSSQLIR